MIGISILALLTAAGPGAADDAALLRDARETMERVVGDIGAADHYRIIADKSGKTHNAVATIINGERVIRYNPGWVRRQNQQADTFWFFRLVVAHEVGHHLGHHLFRSDSDREDEIEADFFAGAALYRMGASFEETIAGPVANAAIPLSITHPSGRERIIYVALGWQTAACRDDPRHCRPTGSPSHEDEAQK